MSVGIYDEDLAYYHSVPFNLDAMKLAAYYKRQNEIVKLTDSFCPERYGKFFYVKDVADGEFLPNLHKYNNLTYRGLAFSNQRYISMPEEIERMKPDTFIYAPLQEKYYTTKIDRANFFTFLNAQHLRVSLDGKTVWKDFECQCNSIRRNKIIYLHDYDVANITGAREAILDFRNELRKTNKVVHVGSKFPIRVYSGEQLVKWTEPWAHAKYLPLQICGLIPDEALYDCILGDERIQWRRPTEYIVTIGCKDDDDFLIRVLPQIFRQVIFLRMNNKQFSLKYEEGFFSNKTLEKLVTLLSSYCNTDKPMVRVDGVKDSLYLFCKSLREVKKFKKDIITRGDAREVFQFVRDKNYEVFKDFYELHSVTLKGGIFIND